MHAYKHIATRRYLCVGVDGRVFAERAGDRYEEVTPLAALEEAFMGWEDLYPPPGDPGAVRALLAGAPLRKLPGNALGTHRERVDACAMPNIGPMEIAIVAVVALLVLGPKRLPSAGRSLGQSIREFKDGIGGRSARELEEADGA